MFSFSHALYLQYQRFHDLNPEDGGKGFLRNLATF